MKLTIFWVILSGLQLLITAHQKKRNVKSRDILNPSKHTIDSMCRGQHGHGKCECPTLVSPQNAALSASSTNISSEVEVVCSPGYVLQPLQTRTCQVNGFWEWEEPTCSLVVCPNLTSPDNGKILTNGESKIRFGDVVTYTCAENYELKGNDGNINRTCMAMGQWSGATPICELVVCPNLTSPDKGNILTNGQSEIRFGDVVTYTCAENYELKGNDGNINRTCMSMGQWSGATPICELVVCPHLTSPHNGNILTNGQSEIRYGDVVTYTCAENYELKGNDGNINRTCMSMGQWSGATPICELVLCPNLTSLDNGNILTNGQSEMRFGDAVTYTCAENYELKGNDGNINRTCMSMGQWSGATPICELVVCPNLTSPDNGNILTNGQSEMRFGDTVTYTCAENYELKGNDGNINRTCMAMGQWSGATPICQCCKKCIDDSIARCEAVKEMDCSPDGAFGINSENSYWFFGQPQFETFFTDKKIKKVENLEFSLWFKTTKPDGVLFFAENAASESIYISDDFIGLSMKGGLVTFSTLTKIDRGVFAATTNTTYNDGEWHFAKMVKNGDFLTLTIDELGLNPEKVMGINEGPAKGYIRGVAHLSAWFYIGGVPSTISNKADKAMGVSQGFQGCIKNITIADLEAGLPGLAYNVN